MSKKQKIERPSLEAQYYGIFKIFENLGKARKNVQAAERCDDPSDAIYYREALDALLRLEAQADALTVAFGKQRKELQQWLTDTEAYYKALEKRSKKR